MKRHSLLVAAMLLPALAAAHPLGNFTTNRWTSLRIEGDAFVVAYAVDFAELPAVRELRILDADHDGTVTPHERSRFLDATAIALARGLVVTLDAALLPLTVQRSSLETSVGAGGLQTMRLDLSFRASLPVAHGTLTFRDTNFDGRPGWSEIIADAATALTGATVPSADRSQALRAYPQDLLTAPLRVTSARFMFAPGAGSTPRGTDTTAAVTTDGRFKDVMTELIASPTPLTPSIIVLSLLVAAMLGAMHALTPGHGKTVVAAYLVGARGTAQHAILLGLIVTATHTLGVYALGLITLTASHWIVPERLFPWISMLSGLVVVGIGATLLVSRLGAALAHEHPHHHHDGDDHHHHHGHSHLPPDFENGVSARSLLALGVSGGLLPCPSALVVMLGAIAVGRIAFGLALIVAFSAGLAAVLTGVGLLLVYARGVFDRFPTTDRFVRFVPVASAVVISAAGLVIVVEALAQIGV